MSINNDYTSPINTDLSLYRAKGPEEPSPVSSSSSDLSPPDENFSSDKAAELAKMTFKDDNQVKKSSLSKLADREMVAKLNSKEPIKSLGLSPLAPPINQATTKATAHHKASSMNIITKKSAFKTQPMQSESPRSQRRLVKQTSHLDLFQAKSPIESSSSSSSSPISASISNGSHTPTQLALSISNFTIDNQRVELERLKDINMIERLNPKQQVESSSMRENPYDCFQPVASLGLTKEEFLEFLKRNENGEAIIHLDLTVKDNEKNAKFKNLNAIDVLKFVQLCPNLEYLIARKCDITFLGLLTILNQKLPKLRILDLAENKIRDGVLSSIEGGALESLPLLQKINLNENDLGDNFISSLTEIELPSLQKLLLRSNLVTDVGAIALANAQKLKTLICIDLSYNIQITEKGYAAFVKSEVFDEKLKMVDLHGNTSINWSLFDFTNHPTY